MKISSLPTAQNEKIRVEKVKQRNRFQKLVGGIDESSGSLAHAFYSTVVDNAHLVSSAEVAESAKLLENIYRAVNIALVNEMKLILGQTRC